jgi:hypothetical protein
MNTARTSAACLAATALTVGLTVVGCSKDESSTPATSSASSSATSTSPTTSTSTSAESSPAAAPNDYSSLLIPATEVGVTAVAQGPAQVNPGGNPGVGQAFANPDGSHRVVDTILVLPDAASADSNFESNDATMREAVTGAPQPVDIGTKGSIATGTSPDGTKAVTVVMFSEGRALVNISFEGAPGDGIPQVLALQIAHKQDDAVKAGLPS